MEEKNIQEDLNYHRNQKWGNYLGTLLCVPGLVAGLSAVALPIFRNQPMYYGDYNVTEIVFFAGLMTMISSSVGLIKSIADAGIHSNKIKTLEEI